METGEGRLLEEKYGETARALHQLVSSLSYGERSKLGTSGSWSVLECIEHIALVADGFSQRIVASPAGVQAPGNPGREEELHRLVRSRETRVAAPHRVQPQNRFASPDEALAEFDRVNAAVLLRLSEGEPQLRALQVQHPALGLLNGYEAFYVIDAHTRRHMAQIEELIGKEVVEYAQ